MILMDDYVDFHHCTDRIFTGGRIITTDHLRQLKDVGITHIINCRDDFDDSVLFTPEYTFEYLWNPTDDDGQPKPTEWFAKAIEFGIQALQQPNCKLYSHCYAGINRGPSIAYAVLRALGIEAIHARNMIKNKRPFADIFYAKDADKAVKELGYI